MAQVSCEKSDEETGSFVDVKLNFKIVRWFS